MTEDIVLDIIKNPTEYTVVIDKEDVTAYSKSNGDTYKFSVLPEEVLVILLKAIGVDTEVV